MKRFVLFVFIILAAAGYSRAQDPDGGLRERLSAHVHYLASDSLEGRRAGEPGGRLAAEYIAEQFRGIGLEPITDSTYMMYFGRLRGRNVIGMIRGGDPELKYEAVVIGAHYDHLGFRTGSGGKKIIYHGADDNASGTAALIELARMMKEYEGELRRTVIFAAFDAEEEGLHGSKAMVGTMLGTEGFPEPVLMVSMDMVGWLKEGKKLRIKGVKMVRDGHGIMETLEVPDGLRVKLVNFDRSVFGGSDHDSFAGEGIPAFYITTGLRSPYHQPEDTADKIDYDGMALVTEYMGSFTGEFATRDEVLPSGRLSRKHKPQRTLEFGVTGALGSNYHDYRKGALTGKPAFGWNAGLYAQVNLGFWAIRPKVLYEGRDAKWPDDAALAAGDLSVSRRFSTQGLYIPVDVMLESSRTSPIYTYIFLGGYYSRAFSGYFADSGHSLGNGINRDEWGWQCGAGIVLFNITVEATARWAITPLLEKGISPDIRNMGAYFTLGYRF